MATKISMSGRLIAIIVALVLAAVATAALVSYVRGVENRALAQYETVQAYVAKDTILEGTSGEEAVQNGLIERAPVPRTLVADGAISELDQLEGKVAAVTIMQGEQILSSRFVAPQEARGLRPIPEGHEAMSVEVGIPPGVAGFVQPGDRVSVVAHVETPEAGAPEPQPDEQAPSTTQITTARYLLQNVEVLAVGQSVVTTTEQGSEGQEVRRSESQMLMTLALTPTQVEQLVFVNFEGQVYFTLLPEDAEPADTPGRTVDNLFD